MRTPLWCRECATPAKPREPGPYRDHAQGPPGCRESATSAVFCEPGPYRDRDQGPPPVHPPLASDVLSGV
eukprot:1850300-Pyramimonas_sp.AAC.1